jgi:hypothetical protein
MAVAAEPEGAAMATWSASQGASAIVIPLFAGVASTGPLRWTVGVLSSSLAQVPPLETLDDPGCETSGRVLASPESMSDLPGWTLVHAVVEGTPCASALLVRGQTDTYSGSAVAARPGGGMAAVAALSESSTTLAFPLIEGGTATTWVQVVNPGAEGTSVQLDVYGPDGAVIYSETREVASLSTTVWDSRELGLPEGVLAAATFSGLPVMGAAMVESPTDIAMYEGQPLELRGGARIGPAVDPGAR